MWTRERRAVCAFFAILGIVCSGWVSSLDDLKVLLGLDDAGLGWLLFAGPVGNLVSFTFASALVARIGARRTVQLFSYLYLASAAALTACFHFVAPLPCWCVLLAFFGGSGNVYNIAVNSQAGLVEKRAGRQIMSSFHAVFSLMMFVGALAASLVTWCAVPVAPRLLATLVLAVALQQVYLRHLPVEDVPASVATASRRWHRPDRALIALGFAALVIMGCEGSICDWVCVFFRDSLHVDPARAKWGFCAVTGLMAFSRFVGDGMVNRLTACRVLHLDSSLVAFGLAIALITPVLPAADTFRLVTAIAGYAIAGFGIAGLIPILYSKVNRTKAMPPASALTFVGSMGFLGYFMGPPLIGHLANLFNLSLALGVFALLILLCLFLDPDKAE